jgi:hypothetical protein
LPVWNDFTHTAWDRKEEWDRETFKEIQRERQIPQRRLSSKRESYRMIYEGFGGFGIHLQYATFNNECG